MSKNIIQKYYDGEKYVELHPVTKTSNVYNTNGENVDVIINNLKNEINSLQFTINNFINPFTMSMTSDINTVELGTVIDSINFTWFYNRNPFSQKFENVDLDPTTRNYTYTNPVMDDKIFTLSAVPYENGPAKLSTVKIEFLNGVYYGVSSSTSYDNALISSLTKILSDVKSRNITVNSSTDEYIYYCIPSRLGEVNFNVGGFTGGFEKVKTILFTNSNGYSENYDIYRSDNNNLGVTNIDIF